MPKITRQQARAFAQSIATLGVRLQDKIDGAEWEDASDILTDLESDIERASRFVNERLIANEEEK